MVKVTLGYIGDLEVSLGKGRSALIIFDLLSYHLRT